MIEENGAQRTNGQESTSWWVIIAAIILMMVTLGGLIYSFIVPVQ